MSSLSFLRLARRVPGLTRQQEFPHLESLLEAEAGRPHQVYRILEIVIPLSILGFGAASVALAKWTGAGIGAINIGAASTVVLSAVSWFVFHRLDKAIPSSTRRVRQLTDKLLKRYVGVANLTGVEPALDPEVGKTLDEAAGIYLKHATDKGKPDRSLFDEARSNAVQALELSMARLLELAEPYSGSAQKRALAAGWAEPLLVEMRELDLALDEHKLKASQERSAKEIDPLARLRDARLGIQKLDTAIEELDDRLTV